MRHPINLGRMTWTQFQHLCLAFNREAQSYTERFASDNQELRRKIVVDSLTYICNGVYCWLHVEQ